MDFDELEGKKKYIAAMIVLALMLTGTVYGYIQKGAETRQAKKDTELYKAEMVKFKRLYSEIASSMSGKDNAISGLEIQLSQCNTIVMALEEKIDHLDLRLKAR